MNSENTSRAGKNKKTVTGWRSHKLLIQVAEYMVGGGVYFWGGMAVFALCFNVFHLPWWVSKGLADIVGWTANFLIQRYWAFYNPRLKGQNRRIITRYVMLNAVNLVIDYLIVWAFVHNGVTPYAGFFVSAGFTTVWNYFWYRFWVFKPS